MVTVNEFQKWLYKYSDFYFSGTGGSLRRLWQLVTKKAGDFIIYRPDNIGYLKNRKIWLFGKTAIDAHGKTYSRDVEKNYITIEKHGYFPKPFEASENDIDALPVISSTPASNDYIKQIAKDEIEERLMPKVKANYDEFWHCTGCDRIYWQGTHYRKIWEKIDRLLGMN